MAHDSPGSHAPLPQQVPPSQHAPQSASQVPHVSPCAHVPSPQATSVVLVVVAPPAPPVETEVVPPPAPAAPPLEDVELDEEPPSPQPETSASDAARGTKAARAGDRPAVEARVWRERGGCIKGCILEDFGAGR